MERVPNKRVLIDAGPLVALLAKDDRHHNLCVATDRTLPRPLFTSWPVLAEAVWLLRRYKDAPRRLLSLIAADALVPLHLDRLAAEEISKMIGKYSDRQPQLADLSLLYLSNCFSIDTIYTLDVRDFTVYRQTDFPMLSLLPEPLWQSNG